MKLVIWSCRRGFHRKTDALGRLGPDIAVVPESANPQILRQKAPTFAPASHQWWGNHEHIGLGAFSFGQYSLRKGEGYTRENQIIAPVRVEGPLRFNLLAVWADNDRRATKGRPGPVFRALERCSAFCDEGVPLVVAGDFNNNVQWDTPRGRNRMADIRSVLEARGLVSAYHVTRGEEFGQESVSTHYWREGTKNGHTYHIDYIFVPKEWVRQGLRFDIGTYEDWRATRLSDHVPLSVELPE